MFAYLRYACGYANHFFNSPRFRTARRADSTSRLPSIECGFTFPCPDAHAALKSLLRTRFSMRQRSMRGSEWVTVMYCLSVVLVLMLRFCVDVRRG